MNRIIVVGKNNELPADAAQHAAGRTVCKYCNGKGGRLYENEDALRMRELWSRCIWCNGRGSL